MANTGIIGLVAGGAVAAIAALTLVFGSWYTVDSGWEAVVLTNGAITDVVDPGLHFKTPLMQGVSFLPLQQQSYVADKLNSLSADQQSADIKVSVIYHVPSGPDAGKQFFTKYNTIAQFEDRYIARVVPTVLKSVFGTYTAPNVPKQRAQINADLTAALKETAKDQPIVIDAVNFENVDFSPTYMQAIEEKQNAEVAVAKQQQVLAQKQVDAQITVTNAKATAEATLAQATADAQATRLRGDAEAAAIKAKSDALNASPSLVEYTKATRWDGKLPTTMVPGTAIPFLDVKPVVAQTPTP